MKKIGIYLLFCLLIVAGARAIAYGPFPELLFIFGALSGLSIEWMAFTIWPETAKEVRYQQFYNFISWSATLIFTASLILKGAMSGLEMVIERERLILFGPNDARNANCSIPPSTETGEDFMNDMTPTEFKSSPKDWAA